MNFWDKLKLVKDFFVFNLRVMTPRTTKIGWLYFSIGIRFIALGLTSSIRGLFHTRELMNQAVEHERQYTAFVDEMNELAVDAALKSSEPGGNPNAN